MLQAHTPAVCSWLGGRCAEMNAGEAAVVGSVKNEPRRLVLFAAKVQRKEAPVKVTSSRKLDFW